MNIVKLSNKRSNKIDFDELDLPMIPPFGMPNDGSKVIESEYHTLFIEDQDPVTKEFQAVDDGETFQVSREIVPKHKKYTLFISLFANQYKELHKVIYELRKATEHDVLEIRINSDGGSMHEGMTIYHTMREIFSGRVTTSLDCAGYSMGAMLFSFGDERIAYDHSELMYHNYSTGIYGKGDNVKSYVEFADRSADKIFKKKLVDNGFLTQEEYDDMLKGRDFWFNTDDMAARGICTHVIVDAFKLDVEAYTEYAKAEVSIEEWVISKLAEMAKEETKEVEDSEEVKVEDSEEKTETKE